MNPTDKSFHDALLDIVLKLLDWPFLLSLVLVLFIFVFRKQLVVLLSREDILFKFGEKLSIQLRDIEDKVDQEVDPLREEVEALTKEHGVSSVAAESRPLARLIPHSEDSVSRVLQRMKDELANPKFRWRSVERLAAISGLSEQEAIGMLRDDPNVVISIAKSGKRIARLKSR